MKPTPIDRGVALFNAGEFDAAARVFEKAALDMPDARRFLLHARLESARAALRAGRRARALRIFRGFLGEDARRPGVRGPLIEAYREWARELLRAGKAGEAEKLLSRALTTGLDDVGIRLDLGALAQQAGDAARAMKVYRDALSRDPRGPGIHLALGELYWRLGDAARATTHAMREISLGTRNPQAHRLLGELYARAGRRTAAVEALRAAVALGAGSEAESLLAQLLPKGAAAPPLGAMPSRAAACAAAPVPPSPLMMQVTANLLQGRFDEAFRSADRLLDQERSQETLERLSFPLITVSNEELKARPELAARLASWGRRHPSNPWPWLVRVYLLHRFDRTERVLEELGHLENLPPRYAWMHFLRAKMILHLRCDYAGAETEFGRAWRGAPELMMARAYMAETALCRGEGVRALRIMDEVVLAHSGRTGADARAWRGAVLLWTGRYRAALSDLTRAAVDGARFAQGWRGGALVQLGRLQEAVRDLDASLSDRPSDQEIVTWRGEAKRRLGLRREAFADLDAAVAMPRGSPWALANRGLLWLDEGDLRRAQADYKAMAEIEREISLKAAGSEPGAELSPAMLRKAFSAALRAARGLRRTDRYLGPLWKRFKDA